MFNLHLLSDLFCLQIHRYSMHRIATEATKLFGPDTGQARLVNMNNEEFIAPYLLSAANPTGGNGGPRVECDCATTASSTTEACSCGLDSDRDVATADSASLPGGTKKKRKKNRKQSTLRMIQMRQGRYSSGTLCFQWSTCQGHVSHKRLVMGVFTRAFIGVL